MAIQVAPGDSWRGRIIRFLPPQVLFLLACDAGSDRMILFSGGETRDTDLDDVWLFDPRSDDWSQVPLGTCEGATLARAVLWTQPAAVRSSRSFASAPGEGPAR